MSLLEAFEIEERVGRLWHRLVGERASWPRHPDAAISLDEVRSRLSVFFRGLGGDTGLVISSASARTSEHRLTWRQKVGMDAERMVMASRDDVSIALPETIDHFPDRQLNGDLYFWLAAFFSALPPAGAACSDPLRADIAFLDRAERATEYVLKCFPGLIPRHAALCQGLRTLRPRRALTRVEEIIEGRVLHLLGGPPPSGFLPSAAPSGYRPFLPVPLWGEALRRGPEVNSDEDEDGEESRQTSQDEQEKRRRAERQQQDNADRQDPIILNRFEKVLAFAEMVNVNRAADDSDEEEAKKAADELDVMTLSRHRRKVATKLKFDLDLPPQATDTARLTGSFLYPEWDYRLGAYRRDHCAVFSALASQEGEGWEPDEAAAHRIRQVRRQFEALRTRPLVLRGQTEGNELDTDAVVRSQADLAACGVGSDRIYLQRRPCLRDLSVAVLVDASLSSDAWVDNRRVLDVEKEALAVLSHGLAACGDSFGIFTFTSRKRSWVRVETVKEFDEPMGDAVMERIGAVRPGYYTRMGAAIRHTAHLLEQRPSRHRLLLVITDGKPNDIDHYEGRYGIEDSRKAVLDTRAKGLTVFGVTIDRKAQTYFPHVFGRGSFAIVHNLSHLSAALPRLYRHLAAV